MPLPASTPYMKKGHNGDEKKNVEKSRKYQPSGAGGTCSPPATPHRLQHLTARLIQNGRQGLERV